LLVASCPDDSIRDPAAATTTMEQFCERATAPNPSAMYALATIYGSQKRYEEGLDLASRAKPLAAQAGNQGLVNRLNLLLSRLRTGQRLGSTKPAPRP